MPEPAQVKLPPALQSGFCSSECVLAFAELDSSSVDDKTGWKLIGRLAHNFPITEMKVCLAARNRQMDSAEGFRNEIIIIIKVASDYRACARLPCCSSSSLNFSTATSFAFASISTVIFLRCQHAGRSFTSMKS